MAEHMQNAHESGRLWQRHCSLIVVDEHGQGLELGELRVVFKITKGEVETPNTANIRVYNLSDQTAVRLRQEFTKVWFYAGYSGNSGLIFTGNVIQYRQGVEGGVNKWLEIWASDGDRAYNFAVVNTTLAAGATALDQIKAATGAMAEKGLQAATLPALPLNSLPRGRALYGAAKTYLRKAARDSGCSWSIQDGQVQVLKNDGYLDGAALTLNYDSGLIGSPEQTNEGIKVRCLINPRLRIGGRVQLNNAAIIRGRTDLFNGDLMLAKLDNDGLYRVLKQEISGDTRGNDWYIDNLCIGIDDTTRKPLDMVQQR